MRIIKWIKKGTKKVISKVTKFAVKKFSKMAFWSLLMFYGPGPLIGVVGIQGLIGFGVFVNSGLIEYVTGKLIVNKIPYIN